MTDPVEFLADAGRHLRRSDHRTTRDGRAEADAPP